MHATTVAVDLAKSVFQIAIADDGWKVVEQPRFDIRYRSMAFASRHFAIAKFTPRFYTVWAGSRQ